MECLESFKAPTLLTIEENGRELAAVDRIVEGVAEGGGFS